MAPSPAGLVLLRIRTVWSPRRGSRRYHRRFDRAL